MLILCGLDEHEQKTFTPAIRAAAQALTGKTPAVVWQAEEGSPPVELEQGAA